MKVSSSKFAQFGIRTNRLAPVMSILVMLGASFLMADPSANHAGITEHRARVAAEMAMFPYQLDAWHGEDVPIPTAAEDILRPNSLVSRRFRRLGGKETIVVAFIHCSDIRDMLGHHPPHCYPAAGWSPTSIGTTDLAVKLAGETVLMRVYRFRRLDTIGIEQHQTVLSMFLLPDSRRVTEMTDLRGSSSKGRRSSAMGVAQLQLVFSGDPTDDTLEVLASDLLTNVPRSLIDALDAPIATETELLEQKSRGDRGSTR